MLASRFFFPSQCPFCYRERKHWQLSQLSKDLRLVVSGLVLGNSGQVREEKAVMWPLHCTSGFILTFFSRALGTQYVLMFIYISLFSFSLMGLFQMQMTIDGTKVKLAPTHGSFSTAFIKLFKAIIMVRLNRPPCPSFFVMAGIETRIFFYSLYF